MVSIVYISTEVFCMFLAECCGFRKCYQLEIRSFHIDHNNVVQGGVSHYTQRQFVPVILAYTLYPINLTNLF
jgi:hypothetical protein